jgi:hypothetical protein
MSPNTCPFCELVNPPGAKFCNACGGALHLVPCARCGAVNDVTAAACYQCNAPIAGRDAGAADAAAPSAEAPKPSSPRRAVAAGTAVVVALLALGYFGYRQDSPVDARQPPPATSAASAGPAAGTAAGDGAQAASAEAVPPEAPLADRVEPQPGEASRTNAASGPIARPQAATAEAAPPETPLADRVNSEPEEARRPNSASGLIARPRRSGAGKAGGQAPARQDVCTDAAAALGLCTMTPEDRKLAEAAAAVNAAMAGPQAADSGEARQPPPRQDACTEAVAALGLCTPESTRRGK